MLNPLTAIVEGIRATLLFGRAPDWTLAAVSTALIVTLLLIALVTFKRMDKYFADVI
jgi:ABC-type polysaccharide/polyol phosphate export permease